MTRPLATAIAYSAISVTIVYATVKAHVRAPIATMKAIYTAFIAPVTGRP
jgi:hypothetical protein